MARRVLAAAHGANSRKRKLADRGSQLSFFGSKLAPKRSISAHATRENRRHRNFTASSKNHTNLILFCIMTSSSAARSAPCGPSQMYGPDVLADAIIRGRHSRNRPYPSCRSFCRHPHCPKRLVSFPLRKSQKSLDSHSRFPSRTKCHAAP